MPHITAYTVIRMDPDGTKIDESRMIYPLSIRELIKRIPELTATQKAALEEYLRIEIAFPDGSVTRLEIEKDPVFTPAKEALEKRK